MHETALAEVVVELTPKDVTALGRAVATSNRYSRLGWTWIAMRGTVAVGLTALAFREPLAGVLLVAEALAIAIEIASRRAARRSPGRLMLDGSYQVLSTGLRRVSALSESLVRWSAVEKIGVTDTHILVRFAGAAWIIPVRCFPSFEERDLFIDALNSQRSVVQTRPPNERPTPSNESR